MTALIVARPAPYDPIVTGLAAGPESSAVKVIGWYDSVMSAESICRPDEPDSLVTQISARLNDGGATKSCACVTKADERIL